MNPATGFDVERSYKWMQGRALPRSRRIYEDWAALLDAEVPMARLQSCSAREFLGLICTRHTVSADALLARAGLDALTPAPRDQPAALPWRQLAGDYACYSPAWSPYFQRRIIRGSLSIQAAAEDEPPALRATYGEEVSVGPYEVQGRLTVLGRSIWLDLVDDDDQNRLSFCLPVPGTLASVLASVMAGATLVDADPRPAACRIVMVRVPPAQAPHLARSNRYIDPREERLSGDLAAHGVPSADPEEVDALLARFLHRDRGSDYIKVGQGESAELAQAFDRLLIVKPPPAGASPAAREGPAHPR